MSFVKYITNIFLWPMMFQLIFLNTLIKINFSFDLVQFIMFLFYS